MIYIEPQRYSFRQLILPEDYRKKMIEVKQIIHGHTGVKPSSTTALMCMIDEFINMHDRKEE